jgi:hypothetical protein
VCFSWDVPLGHNSQKNHANYSAIAGNKSELHLRNFSFGGRVLVWTTHSIGNRCSRKLVVLWVGWVYPMVAWSIAESGSPTGFPVGRVEFCVYREQSTAKNKILHDFGYALKFYLHHGRLNPQRFLRDRRKAIFSSTTR